MSKKKKASLEDAPIDYEQIEYANQYLMETNIDDMNAELYAYVEEKLFEYGALDVYKNTHYHEKKEDRPSN